MQKNEAGAALTSRGYRKAIILITAFVALVLAGAVLKLTAQIFILFTISVFLAFVMGPIVATLERRLHFNRFISILLASILIVAGLTLIGAVLYSSARTILTRYMLYEERLLEIYRWVGGFLGLSYDQELGLFENLWAQLEFRDNIRHYTLEFSNHFITFLKNALMVVLFVVFLLIEAASIKIRVERAFENKLSGQIRTITSAVARETTRYLTIKFLISLVTGVVVGIALQIAGVEFAPVWAVIQFILNFVPIIGSVAVGVAASLFALLQFWPSPGPVVAVVFIMLSANILLGIVLEPRVMGYNLGISPLVILLSLLLWGWLWGFAGLILAVPMTVIIKIICENVPFLEPVSILLGSGKAAKAARNRKAAQP